MLGRLNICTSENGYPTPKEGEITGYASIPILDSTDRCAIPTTKNITAGDIRRSVRRLRKDEEKRRKPAPFKGTLK
jgi:hypothetical protein